MCGESSGGLDARSQIPSGVQPPPPRRCPKCSNGCLPAQSTSPYPHVEVHRGRRKKMLPHFTFTVVDSGPAGAERQSRPGRVAAYRSRPCGIMEVARRATLCERWKFLSRAVRSMARKRPDAVDTNRRFPDSVRPTARSGNARVVKRTGFEGSEMSNTSRRASSVAQTRLAPTGHRREQVLHWICDPRP